MRALTILLETYTELKKKMVMDPSFKPKIYEIISLQDVPDLNLINENWVKIKVKLGGICGSDMSIVKLKNSMVQSSFTSFPMILGHEIVGEIVEIGSAVSNVSIGDRVICDTNFSCLSRGIELCPQCKNGDYNLCSMNDKGDIAPGLIFGTCKDTGGGWGEYVVAHKSQVYKIPENTSFEEAVIAEPLACVLHGVFKVKPEENDRVLVIGCGTMGLTTILAFKALYKCEVIAIAKYAYQSELAKKLGADQVFSTEKFKKIGKTLGSRIIFPIMEKPFPMGGGADIVVDSVGNEQSLADSFRLVKAKGKVLLIGYPAHLTIDWTPLIWKEITIISSNIFSHDKINGEVKRTMEIALDLISSNKVNVKDFLTQKLKIDDYKKALEIAINKSEYEAIKIAFEYE
ncbi:MAG: zinc-binding dehydrogenase [Promethearchaeota archaeon]